MKYLSLNSNWELQFLFKGFFLVLLIGAVEYMTMNHYRKHNAREQEIMALKESLSQQHKSHWRRKSLDLEHTPIPTSTSEFSGELKPKDVKQILFGTGWYEVLGSKFPYLDLASSICPECTFTQDKNLFNSSDAVVFHAYTLPKDPRVLSRRSGRSPDQIWVWMFEESAQKTHGRLDVLGNYTNLFNWTMTFRRNSDVVTPYGRFVSIKETPLPAFDQTWAFLPSDVDHKSDLYNTVPFLAIPSEEDLKGRKLIAWISSHCSTASRRELVASELGKYVPIDIYGRCGNLSCGSEASYNVRIGLTGNAGIDCRIKISTSYKFYLSFENSLCEDYVTEKYFDTLLTQMVPIVYGAANYSDFAPPKSFINVADFATIKELADHLIYLDNNPKEFLKYFEWRKDYWVQNNGYIITYCSLCKKLWDPTNVPKFYTSIKDWYLRRSDFASSGNNTCIDPPPIRAS